MLRAMHEGQIPGIETLQNAYYEACTSPHKFKAGYQYQIEESYKLYTAGRLQAVEIDYSGDGMHRVDAKDTDGQFIEFKNYSAPNAGILASFQDQVKQYARCGCEPLDFRFKTVPDKIIKSVIKVEAIRHSLKWSINGKRLYGHTSEKMERAFIKASERLQKLQQDLKR